MAKISTIRLRISCFSALRIHFRGIFPKCDNLLQFTVMIIMSVSMGSSHLHPHCPMIPKLLSFSFTLFCGPCNKSLLIKRLNDFKALLPTHRSHRILNGENSTIQLSTCSMLESLVALLMVGSTPRTAFILIKLSRWQSSLGNKVGPGRCQSLVADCRLGFTKGLLLC